jgi:hypothetical protein
MKYYGLIGFFLLLFLFDAQAQCDFYQTDIDDFDSTLTVVSNPVSLGFIIASDFETADGPKMVEEGKMLFSYAENDSINSFFMTVGLLERKYLKAETGMNVRLKLSNNKIVTLFNIPDKGTFDRTTNMRIYQHTCIVPLDMYYLLTYNKVEKIRVEYPGNAPHDLTISTDQQEALLEAMKCVGERVGLYPVKP